MQTFLPYPNFQQTAEALDWRRLGKQRVEAKQILMILLNEPTLSPLKRKRGWVNHPAVKMWKGYEAALALYGYTICVEWRKRGYVDNQLEYFAARLSSNPSMPMWLTVDFCRAHQSNLKRKLPEHYKFDVPADLEYVWPTREVS